MGHLFLQILVPLWHFPQGFEDVLWQVFLAKQGDQYCTQFIWRFPKMGVPLNHSFIVGLSIINHPFWGTPIYGKPIWVNFLHLECQFWSTWPRELCNLRRALPVSRAPLLMAQPSAGWCKAAPSISLWRHLQRPRKYPTKNPIRRAGCDWSNWAIFKPCSCLYIILAGSIRFPVPVIINSDHPEHIENSNPPTNHQPTVSRSRGHRGHRACASFGIHELTQYRSVRQ